MIVEGAPNFNAALAFAAADSKRWSALIRISQFP
jgi:hypothetical protein